eukprot:TRINITY_DN29559_c0_g1_i1.p1 TRINITY_DN29559_c0_g1~~TRINITY_DN29559_c0_g1_i1.p1  ORF type:complete len:284 (-),score=68.22 TRINITY_DN29559_c0_g1_i1:229-1080(-)
MMAMQPFISPHLPRQEYCCCFLHSFSRHRDVPFNCSGRAKSAKSTEAQLQKKISRLVILKEGFKAVAIPVCGFIFPDAVLAKAEACQDSYLSVFNMPILFGIALVGAAVGGSLARQRRNELERLNNQLRLINKALKRQARIESYAPNLSYAPVGRSPDAQETLDTRKDDMTSKLKEGKKYLRLQNPQKAFEEFKVAYEIAQNLQDPTEAKKAARGMGASCQRQRKFREAIKYHSLVLSISESEREYSGETEALGAIADCYTELGDLETAAKYYDKYIERLETD